MTNADKQRVLFVGGFVPEEKGAVGGQVFACRTLMASPLSEFVQWRTIDSFRNTNRKTSFIRRSCRAAARLVHLCWCLIFFRPDTLLIFTAFSSPSRIEKGLMCLLGKLFRTRIVLSFRSDPHPVKQFPSLHTLFIKWVVRCCDHFLCQSEMAADALRKHFSCPDSKLTIISNWIETSRYTPRKDKLWWDQRDDSTPNLLFFGYLEERKGVVYLLDAMRQLLDRGVPTRLVVCGTGPLEQSLRDHAQQTGISDHVDFRGWVDGDEKIATYHQADVFVLPSFREGMPNALLEATAAGLPVISTTVDSIPSLISSERQGQLVQPGDSATLADAIAKIVADPESARAMGRYNREQALKNHDILRVWPRVAKLLGVAVPEIATSTGSDSKVVS